MADLDIKPAAALTPAQIQQINDAIVDSFAPAELGNALRYKWGVILRNYVNTQQGFYDVVADLIAWTDRRGKTRELAALTYAERPGNPTVQQMAGALGLALADVEQKYNLTKPQPPKPPLEAMVARQSHFVDYNKFLSRFQSLGSRICKIETPTKLGTGFLVGADLVLTNYHVIDEIKAPDDAKRILCQFDFHDDDSEVAAAANKTNGVTLCRLSSEGIIAKSPYSDSDISGVGEPEANEFDYALLRLAEKIGDAPAPPGSTRGWFDLLADRPLLAVRDYVVIPQHARGRPLEVAWGAVLGFSSLGTRVRYDTSTDCGSSGSPCFTVDLNIFGLHHATDPKKIPQYNQAIPLDMIVTDLKAKGAI
jgi:hypothetical protein